MWLLLTPNAIRESVWTHHEFGYFYGYGHGVKRDEQGHRLRFLYVRGTELRGLYTWIVGTEIESLDDPIAIARVIAKGIGRDFEPPANWVPRQPGPQLAPSIRHPSIGPIAFSSSGLVGGPGTADVSLGLRDIDEAIYSVSALTSHTDIDLTPVSASDVIGPKYPGSVVFRVRYREKRANEKLAELTDPRGRKFNILAGRRAPDGKTPLLITFETEDHRALAAVFYFSVSLHSKGFPEINLHAPVPLEWRQGSMPSG